ncbi:MAG: response regulator transcription factor [Dehalococcoidia bacterium]|nr:response regulator transcription factor [Dehalococcoidia bacterium]
MIRVLIADDHAVVREGLKQILAGTPDMVVADEARSGQEVLEKVRKSGFDVVVLDISMPGGSGLDVLKGLRGAKPGLSVLVLSVHPEEQYAVRVMRAGASGYVTKDSAPDELIAAIRKVSQGRKYVSPSLAERLASDLAVDAEKPPHERLSDREYEVMCLIASGKSVTEIARQLTLSVKTISTYRSRVLKKTNMRSSAELTHYAIKQGLVD